MKKNIKYIIYFGLIAVFLICGIYSYIINDKDYAKERLIEENDIINKKESYSFTTTQDNLKKIKIKFSEVSIENNDKITVKLYTNKGKKIKKVVIKQLDYENGYTLSFDKIKNSSEKEFKIVIENTSHIDGLQLESITASYLKDINRVAFIIVITVVTIVVSIITLLLEKKNFKIENSYLILAIFIYGLFIIFFPLFTAHDELYHWFRAYEISEGKLLSGIHDNRPQSSMPTSVGEIYNTENQYINYRTTADALSVEESNNTTLYDMRTVAIYSPVQYIPQSLGILVAKIFTDKTLIMAYCGRLFNALLSIALIYFAIKIIPIGKRIIFTIAFLPIAIEGFTSLSADAITISAALLLLAYILKLRYDPKVEVVRKKDCFIIILLSFVIALCKIVYLPLVLMCFLIPKEKFKSKKMYLVFCIITVLTSIILNLIWLKIASGYLSLASKTGVQVSSIFNHPLEYIMTVIYTFAVNAKQYLFAMVGEGLAWGERVHPLSIVLIGFLMLLLTNTLFDYHKEIKFGSMINSIFTTIVICVIGLIFTSLYIQWSSPGNPTIAGIQGRYFLPILPLALLLISNLKLKISQKINLNNITIQLCLIFSYSVLLTLFVHYI